MSEEIQNKANQSWPERRMEYRWNHRVILPMYLVWLTQGEVIGYNSTDQWEWWFELKKGQIGIRLGKGQML